jgi:1,2-diacylglycerol 3-beta-galactosyltransferase
VKKLDFIYFDAGGGHRSAANALRQVIERQGRPWEVRMVNLQEVLDPLDIFRKLTGLRLQDVYNLTLKKGWTLGSPQLLAGMHAILRLYLPAQVRLLRRFWQENRPDLVVSLVPNFNRALCEGLGPRTPLVTILTDIADYPPHFWIERQRQYFICGSGRAAEQAREISPGSRVFRVSGMILNPRFYEPPPGLESPPPGLRPDLPAGLVLFGGEGSPAMLEIARRLESLPVQLIMICGHNEKLAAKLRALKRALPMHVQGYTREVPYYMRVSDFFIGKPGPGSISEALAMKLPVIVERNAWTLPQERYNADWVLEKGVGLVVRNFREIGRAVAELLEPANYARFRAAAAAIDNRAVFEIPDILETILCVSQS